MCLEDLKKRELLNRKGSKEAVSLNEMNPGQRGKILKIRGGRGMNKQLADMGVSSGSIIEVESQALEDTVEVKVRGYHLTLTNDDAGRISVELHQ